MSFDRTAMHASAIGLEDCFHLGSVCGDDGDTKRGHVTGQRPCNTPSARRDVRRNAAIAVPARLDLMGSSSRVNRALKGHLRALSTSAPTSISDRVAARKTT